VFFVVNLGFVMKNWLALKNLFIILLIFATVMLIFDWLNARNTTAILIPTPQMTAQQFVMALKARRYQAARAQLSEKLESQLSDDQLKAFYQSLKQNGFEISDTREISEQIISNHAFANLQIEFKHRPSQQLTFSLVKQQGQWKLDSIQPLQSLIQL
jgi:hypothetical protein